MSSSCSKRKLSTIDSDRVDYSHPKRRRVREATSPTRAIPRAPIPPSANYGVAMNAGGVKAPQVMKKDDQVEKLKAELKEIKERLARVEQESNRKSDALSRVREMIHCSICKEIIRNPYTLECGHSACCRCLRKCWLTSGLQNRPINNITVDISDDESENEEDEGRPAVLPQSPYILSTSSSSHAHPLYPSRPRFKSVLHSVKQCPECRSVVTNRPVPSYRLRDIIDALHPSPLSSMAQMKRDQRWGRRQREDVWKGIFPTSGDGSAIRSTPTQQEYILPSAAQGRIQAPLSTSSLSSHVRHTERRPQSHNYRFAQPQRRERQRWERYDPVREARSEVEEQPAHQRHPRAPSPPVRRTRTRLNQALPRDGGLEPGTGSTSQTQLLYQGLSPLEILFQTLEPPRALGPQTASSSAPQSRLPPPLQLQRLTPFFQSQSQSQLNPRTQLPSLRELLSCPISSDVTLPPLSNRSPTALEPSRITHHQYHPCPPSDNGVGSDAGGAREDNVDEQREDNNTDGNNADISNSSESSEAADDVWIGADLED